MCTTLILGKNVTQRHQSKIKEKLPLEIYLCRLCLKQGREIQDFRVRESEREREYRTVVFINRVIYGEGFIFT